MKRFPLVGILFLVPAFALLGLTACGDKKDNKSTTGPGKTDNKGAAKTKYKDMDGTITGTVKLKGDEPAIADIEAIGKMEAGKDKEICKAGDTKEQLWVFDKTSKGVANVVVWLEPAADKEFDIKDAFKKPFEKPAMIHQPNCQYEPHVTAVYAGVQKLMVHSSKKIAHNVKISAGRENDAYDSGNIAIDGPNVERSLKYDEKPLDMSCSIHTWMRAKLFTFDHPYFAVTGKDGKFKIENVPSDGPVMLYVWHESKGKTTFDAYKAAKGDNSLELSITSKGEVTK